MHRFKRIIPNSITSLNIVCGTLSVIFAFEGMVSVAGYLIILAAVFDFFDGMSARLLNAYSELGKQLDSLADMISFGLAPSIIAYQIMKMGMGVETLNHPNTDIVKSIYLFSVVLIPVFSGLRLAKFNIDTEQTHNFIGLPTPANALIYASIAIIGAHSASQNFLWKMMSNPNILLSIIVISSLLLVAPLPMFSLKFKHLRLQGNVIRYIFLGFSLLIIIGSFIQSGNELASGTYTENALFVYMLKEILYIIAKAMPFILMVYVLLSIVTRMIYQITKHK